MPSPSFNRSRVLASRQSGFTLVEIMIVVGILAIIIAIAAPTWVRQREISQLRTCQENLTKINGAKQQWALETNNPGSAEPGWDDLVNETGDGFLKKEPVCPASGTYTLNTVNEDAACSISDPDHNADPSDPIN
jgi:prepilin-type N-terminal cleavage/methylation domain-containing protein